MLQEVQMLSAHPKVKAIGEIGLDYYWKENPPKELQQHVFRCQLELAEALHLPVIVRQWGNGPGTGGDGLVSWL